MMSVKAVTKAVLTAASAVMWCLSLATVAWADSWVQEAKLLAADGRAYDWFGQSVSTDGSNAIVGACFNQESGWRSGSAYILQRSGSGWTQAAKVSPTDGWTNDMFGYSVSISG